MQAFPYDEAPRFVIRDHDGIHGQNFRQPCAGSLLPPFSRGPFGSANRLKPSPAARTTTDGIFGMDSGFRIFRGLVKLTGREHPQRPRYGPGGSKPRYWERPKR